MSASAQITRIQVALDSRDPHSQAQFWAAALGYEVEDHTEIVDGLVAAGQLPAEAVVTLGDRRGFAEVAACRDPAGTRPRLFIQAVPEGKLVKNRMHLDLQLGADLIDDEVARLLALGASVAWESSDRGTRSVTLRDPEGNEFCV